MSASVNFPEMRMQVVAALRSLSDVPHQQTRWGLVEKGVDYYDDLSLNVHILYDDCAVLPEPSRSVGTIIYPREVPALAELASALGPMLDDLDDAADEIYTRDPRWPAVVQAARSALVAMRRSDEGTPP